MAQVSFTSKPTVIILLGHFHFTFMLGEKGFNEIDLALLKQLIFNEKPLMFVRTQCDAAVMGIQDKFEEKV